MPPFELRQQHHHEQRHEEDARDRQRVRQVHVRRVAHMISSVVAMKAILLAGGKGTRLRPLTIHTPKPIVPIFDRPFLHYQLDLLKQVPEIDEVILSLNYQPRRIEEIFGDGGDSRPRHPLRRRAGAARHGRRRPLRGRVAARVGRRLQRRRPDAGRPRRRHRAAPRAQGQGDDRADAGRQPDGLRPGRNRRRTATSGGSSRSRSRTRSPATRSTPASTSSSPTPSTGFPKDTPWSIERSFFPSLIERGETFVAYVYRGYWIDIGTPEKYMQVHRDIMDGRYQAAPFADAPAPAWVSPGARVEEGAQLEGPCFIDDGAVVKTGARIGPYSVIGRQCHVEEHAVVERRDRLGEHAHQPGGGRAPVDPRPPLPHRPQRRRSRTASSSATSPSSPTTAGL